MTIKFKLSLGRTFVLIFFLALFFKITNKSAYACSCLRPAPPLESKQQATAVFAGTVISQERSEFEVKVNLRVQRVWKGEIGDTVTIITNTNSAACGVYFRNREKYLVYAFQNPNQNKNQLTTNLCSRTQSFSRASEDLKQLGPGNKPKKIDPNSTDTIEVKLSRYETNCS
ncbi:MAG: hypothetical protein QNJ38_11955 [Prochloraceae cyanobacterium]|nr:hypothetical protein [Prochloraceae cyanobacterium]